ncbi:hypothetical protein AB4Z29_21825 [Paenibacillus sp. 2TAB23]|uniref:hypothetical protein n=1 Tax=Paenibacillus sp. 2TAB23 TaxID=3233004 RepID=UPI003F960D6C
MMQKQGRIAFLWMNYFLLGISVLFYIVLLRAPSAFLEGAAAGMIVYGGCYGLIRIRWQWVVRGALLAVFFSIFAFALYTVWYVLQKL